MGRARPIASLRPLPGAAIINGVVLMSEAAILTHEFAPAASPLAAFLRSTSLNPRLREYSGTLTPEAFSTRDREVAAALKGHAIFDLGYRTRILITGEDRLRWLNGMVSNAIQTLPEGHGNYNFVLNAQGRIQGDGYIYRAPDHLLLDTDVSQSARLLAHLDHFIIMDDVELHRLDEAQTAIGLIGPQAAAALDGLGLCASKLEPLQWSQADLAGVLVTVVRGHGVLVPRYELWFAAENAALIWGALASAAGEPIGVNAVEAVRVVEGTPRYGADFNDRHLPQETSQTRALNFSKGCYLGQEIVERIRSRATVHRNLCQFALEGEVPKAPADLRLPGEDSPVVGQLTSVAEVRLPEFHRTFALGFLRTEALGRKSPVQYDGGSATVLPTPPALPWL